MGDARFEAAYEAVVQSTDRSRTLRELDDQAVIAALAAASRAHDPLLANVLATEAENRMRRLRAALAHMAEGVLAIDREGAVQWLNPAAEQLLKWRREDAVGRSFHALVDHADAERELIPHEECPLLLAAQHGESQTREGEFFLRHDGSCLCVDYTSAPIRAGGGETVGSVLVFRDCAARKDHERALVEARERFESLFQDLPIPIVTLDLQGTVLDANRRAEEATGRSREEARGHSFTAFIPPDDVERARVLFAEIVEGNVRTAQLGVLHKAGHIMRVRATGVPSHEGGRVRGVHCLFEVLDDAPEAPVTLAVVEQEPDSR